jgi:hypothetical protein
MAEIVEAKLEANARADSVVRTVQLCDVSSWLLVGREEPFGLSGRPLGENRITFGGQRKGSPSGFALAVQNANLPPPLVKS